MSAESEELARRMFVYYGGTSADFDAERERDRQLSPDSEASK